MVSQRKKIFLILYFQYFSHMLIKKNWSKLNGDLQISVEMTIETPLKSKSAIYLVQIKLSPNLLSLQRAACGFYHIRPKQQQQQQLPLSLCVRKQALGPSMSFPTHQPRSTWTADRSYYQVMTEWSLHVSQLVIYCPVKLLTTSLMVLFSIQASLTPKNILLLNNINVRFKVTM